MAHVVVAHLALDASGVLATSAADGPPGCDFLQQRITPACPARRGEWPQLAASCA